MANYSPANAKFLPDLKISQVLIGDAALAIPDVKEALKTLGFTSISPSVEHVKEAMGLADYNDTYLFDWNKPVDYSKDYLEGQPLVISKISNLPRQKFWDATLVLNMVATNVIDTQNISHVETKGKLVAFFGFDPKYKAAIEKIYTALPVIKYQKVQSIPLYLANLKGDVKNYGQLEKALLRNMGEITFGWPVVYTAKEMNLVLPASVTRKFDTYWLELSATFRDLSARNLEELAINFAVPDGSLALELVPTVVALPIFKEKKIKTPDIGVRIRGVKVTVGEFFSRTVSYTYLKPIIESFGLRESRFSWTLKDEAVRAGSHKFVVIIGVPKGKDGTEIAMSAHIKSKGYLFSGDIAGTEVHTMWVDF